MMDFYGDSVRWFIGVVVDNNDPLQLDRVRVRIHGIHGTSTENIDTPDLPWAQVSIPVTEGGSSGIGANCQLKVRAQVFGVFLDGKNSQLPLVLGSIPKIETLKNEVNDDGEPAQNNIQSVALQQSGLANLDSELVGATNLEKIFNFFISEKGGPYKEHQVAAMCGHFLQEAGRTRSGDIKIDAISGTDKIKLADGTEIRGFGIAQWNPQAKGGYDKSRLAELINFSGTRKLDYKSLYAQVHFVKYELATSEKTARRKLQSTLTVEQATKAFDYYERPSGFKFEPYQPSKSIAKRIKNADEVFNKFKYGQLSQE
tara:strand:- start:58 stop:999 length:942 start_codon:yes stop_codon:yes gene_type:complete